METIRLLPYSCCIVGNHNLVLYKVQPSKHVWRSDHSCRQTLYAIESPAHDVWTSSVIWNINAVFKSLPLNVPRDFKG